MSDGKRRLRDALARQAEPRADREAREAQEREDAIAFFEQTIVPAFEEAANEINQQAAANVGERGAPARADARLGPSSRDGMVMELAVRCGGVLDFWFRGHMNVRRLPVQWTFRRNPRVKNDGTATSEGTEKELKWNVAVAEMTAEQITDDLLMRYAEVVEARDRQRQR